MAATYILPLKAICNLSASVVFRFRGPLALGAILPQTRMITGFFAFFKNLPEQHRFNESYARDIALLPLAKTFLFQCKKTIKIVFLLF